MDPILPAARSSLLEINLCLMAPYDMTDGTRHKWIQTQVHLHKNSSLSPYPFPPPCFHSLRAEAWKTVFKPDFLFLNTRKISCLRWSTSCTLEIWFGSGFAKTWRFDDSKSPIDMGGGGGILQCFWIIVCPQYQGRWSWCNFKCS